MKASTTYALGSVTALGFALVLSFGWLSLTLEGVACSLYILWAFWFMDKWSEAKRDERKAERELDG